MIDYAAIAEAGGIPKTSKPNREAKKERKTRKRQNSTLSSKKRLKKTSRPIPDELQKEVMEHKSNLCFCGECEVCGGKTVHIRAGFHHFPHKGPGGGKDIFEHLWPSFYICQKWYHEHPEKEKELFQRLEARGFMVDWGAKVYGGKT